MNILSGKKIFMSLATIFITLVATLLATSAFVPGAAAQAACESPYVVQRGDTLSEIAVRCNTTVEALVQANPGIQNPSLIFTGQRLTIPGASIPDTGAQANLQLNPASGPAGTTVTVTGAGFPASSSVRVGHGVGGSEPVEQDEVNTNAQGRFTTRITVPGDAGTELPWVVLATPLAGGGQTIRAEFNVTAVDGAGEQRYTVQRGDTLSEIAARFGTSVQALVRANPQIDDPRLIFPGQELIIPGSLVVIPDTGERVYVVERGDTLSEIAVRFGTTVDALLEQNPQIENRSRIFPGQRLTIQAPVDVIPDTGQTVYVVQRGDTLSEIAVRFRTTVAALVEANPEIEDPNLIFTGQRIVIPGTGGS